MGNYIAQSPAQRAARKKQSENWRKQQRRFDNQALFDETDLTKQPNVVRDLVRNEHYMDDEESQVVSEIRGQISTD